MAARTIAIRLTAENAEAVRRQLEELGRGGEQSLRRIEGASDASGAGVRRLATASDGAVRSFGGLSVAAGGMVRGFGGVSAALSAAGLSLAAVAAGAGVAAGAIARAGDEMTASLSRLRAATGSTQAAADAYERLYRLSLQTGIAVSESADAFSRFAIAARAIGATTEQTTALVRTIQQAGIIAGSSAQETGAAVLQLGQALASGTLQGDELRSLLEAMPNLAEALARELGVSVGELRKMGSEGQLTAERVFPALIRAGETLNRQFEQLEPTIGRSFGALGVAMNRFAADLDRALGISRAIAQAAQAAAAAVDRGRVAVGLGTPQETAQSGYDGAMRRAASEGAGLAQLERQIEGLRGMGRDRALTVPERAILETLEAQAAPLRAAQAAALAEAERFQLELTEIEREALVARLQEQDAAARTRLEAERRQAAEVLETQRRGLDQRGEIERAFLSQMRDLRRARGVASEEVREIEALREVRVRAGQDTAEVDRTLADARARVTEATNLLTAAERERQEKLDRLNRSAATGARNERDLAEARGGEPFLNPETGLLALSPEDANLQNRVARDINRRTAADERAAAQRAQAAERAAEAAARPVDRLVERFGDGIADALVEGMTEGSSRSVPLIDRLANFLRTAATRALAEGLSSYVIQPAARYFLGGAAGALGFGGGGGGAVGSAGGGFSIDRLLSGGGRLLGLGDTGSFLPGGISGLLGSSLYSVPAPAYLQAMASAPLGAGVSGPVLSPGAAAQMGIPVSVSSAALGAAGVIGGGFGIYQGIQTGGARGFAQGVAGAAGLAGGAITLAGGGAGAAGLLGLGAAGAAALGAIATVAPYIAAIAAVAAMFLPGQKPTNAAAGGFVDLASGVMVAQDSNRANGQTSEARRAILQAFNDTVRSLEGLVGGRPVGRIDVEVGQRDPSRLVYNGREVGRAAPGDTEGLTDAFERSLFDAYLSSNLSGDVRSIFNNSGGSLQTAIGNLQWYRESYEPTIASLRGTDTENAEARAMRAFNDQMAALRKPFEDMTARARSLGLAVDDLAKAADKAVADFKKARDEQLEAIGDGLELRLLRATGREDEAFLREFEERSEAERKALGDTLLALAPDLADTRRELLDQLSAVLAAERAAIDAQLAERDTRQARGFLESLALGDLGGLAPEQRYFSGLTLLNTARQTALEGGSLDEFSRVAGLVLPVARDFLGTSERYAGLVAEVAETIRARGGDPNNLAAIFEASAAGSDRMAELFADIGERQIEVGTKTLAEIRRLAGLLEAVIARNAA
jgi:tape measure domain-containing protein